MTAVDVSPSDAAARALEAQSYAVHRQLKEEESYWTFVAFLDDCDRSDVHPLGECSGGES